MLGENGNNGKTTFVNRLLKASLGEYASTLNICLLTGRTPENGEVRSALNPFPFVHLFPPATPNPHLVPPPSPFSAQAATPMLAGARKRKLLVCNEGDKRARLNPGITKLLTGNDPILVRGLYERTEVCQPPPADPAPTHTHTHTQRLHHSALPSVNRRCSSMQKLLWCQTMHPAWGHTRRHCSAASSRLTSSRHSFRILRRCVPSPC